MAILLAASPLGCNEIRSDYCPPLTQYSQAFLNEAANELDAILTSGKYPHIVTLTNDYKKLRDQVRACLRKKRPTA